MLSQSIISNLPLVACYYKSLYVMYCPKNPTVRVSSVRFNIYIAETVVMANNSLISEYLVIKQITPTVRRCLNKHV